MQCIVAGYFSRKKEGILTDYLDRKSREEISQGTGLPLEKIQELAEENS
jgi:hypothetical protein